jgi:hypothetical protein
MTKQPDMIERVARAMCEQCAAEFGGPVKLEESPAREAWISSARAAIEAMHEPTEAMEMAGNDALSDNGVCPVDDSDAPLAWRAMIDEALATQNTEEK